MEQKINKNYYECENLDIIKVSYSISHINIYSTRLKKKKRISKNYKYNSWTEQVFNYLVENNINVIGKNCAEPNNDYFIVSSLSNSFDYFD